MCTALVVGNMIGSGVFLLPAVLAPFGGISILGWLFSAAGAILLALVFARLSRMVPRVGGPYAYTRLGFGDLAGFLVAWGYWIAIWIGNTAISVAFVGYLGVFWRGLAENALLSAVVALAAVVYILATVAVMGVIPPPALSESTAPFADAARAMWGSWAAYAVAAGAAISAFGGLNGWIPLQGQIPFAVARDGLFPARFGRLSKNGTPVFGLLVGSVLVTLLMSINYTRGLVDLFTFAILLSTLTTLGASCF